MRNSPVSTTARPFPTVNMDPARRTTKREDLLATHVCTSMIWRAKTRSQPTRPGVCASDLGPTGRVARLEGRATRKAGSLDRDRRPRSAECRSRRFVPPGRSYVPDHKRWTRRPTKRRDTTAHGSAEFAEPAAFLRSGIGEPLAGSSGRGNAKGAARASKWGATPPCRGPSQAGTGRHDEEPRRATRSAAGRSPERGQPGARDTTSQTNRCVR